MDVQLDFQPSGNKFEAIVQQDTDVKCQVVFPDGLSGQIILSESMDGNNFDTIGVSNIGNAPIIKTHGLTTGDYIKLTVNYEPLSYSCRTLS